MTPVRMEKMVVLLLHPVSLFSVESSAEITFFIKYFKIDFREKE